ncbi:hypothetical protein DAPPUDRAFT_325178 [Daphnia pulex]|uniref:Uncharacterized protein n=1 Tax=Daphnia pulex TaxID=6669 RepID=E9H3Y5_DAPPU|nr:hypothetical protein DAPPUDRAFT_325178 [Daphnia pulex]|eukprot:EFX73632.1 hypothetical protein DAPPUDRAFT_325178 [Daphnia pulex]
MDQTFVMATNNMVDVYGTSSHKQQCRRVPQFLKSGSCNSQSVSGKIYSVNESRGRKDRLESQIIVARATTTKDKKEGEMPMHMIYAKMVKKIEKKSMMRKEGKLAKRLRWLM